MLKSTSKQPSLFSSLTDLLDQKHPLFQLADKIKWETFETAFSLSTVKTMADLRIQFD